MKIVLKDARKSFGRHKVIKSFSHTFNENEKWAIRGKNGSGKSTLLQLICGSMLPAKGMIEYFDDSKLIDSDNLYKYISIAAPYMDLVEELSFNEHIDFQLSFKPFANNLSKKDILEISGLGRHQHRPIKVFSSGMKQRAKLTLATLTKSSLLLLDEPCSNLDAEGTEWYQNLVKSHIADRTVIVFSNFKQEEYHFCDKLLEI